MASKLQRLILPFLLLLILVVVIAISALCLVWVAKLGGVWDTIASFFSLLAIVVSLFVVVVYVRIIRESMKKENQLESKKLKLEQELRSKLLVMNMIKKKIKILHE